MFFEISLYVSLAIFGLGLIYKVSAWFRRSIGVRVEDIPTSVRLIAERGLIEQAFSILPKDDKIQRLKENTLKFMHYNS